MVFLSEQFMIIYDNLMRIILDILGDLAERMENTDATIVSQTRSVAIIDRKDSTCGNINFYDYH